MTRVNITASRQLRAAMTEAEQLIWRKLRKRQLHGARFRRQFVIAPYIVDFACIEHKVVIELDGGQHDERRNHDRERTRYLNHHGWCVLRFWNNDVFQYPDSVLEVIAEAILARGKEMAIPPP